MTPTTEAATLRRRQDEIKARLDRIGSDAPSARSTRIARVVDLGDKAAVARSVVAVVPVRIEVDRVEGAVPVLTAAPDEGAFLALNLGGSVPPVGLDVLLDLVDGFPCFRHG